MVYIESVFPINEGRNYFFLRFYSLFFLVFFSGSLWAECDTNPPAGFNVSQTCSTREVAHEACSNQASAQMAAWGGSVSCGFYGGVETQYRLLTAGGGLSNYAAHSWADECPPGETWNDSTKSCDIPCELGVTKTLLVPVGIYPPPGATMDVRFIQTNSGLGAELEPLTACLGACTFSIPRNPGIMGECGADSSTSIAYCRTQGTATGGVCTGGDTALDAAIAGTDEPIPSASAGCIRTRTGDEVCASSPKKNCGTVNGIEVCANSDGSVSIGGNQVDFSSSNENGQIENCYIKKDGSVACIELPTVDECPSGPSFITCVRESNSTTAFPPFYSSSDPKVPVHKDVQEKTTTDTEVAPDGTTTVTSTTTTNIINSTATTQTTVYNPAGEVTSQTTQKGVAGGESASGSTGSDQEGVCPAGQVLFMGNCTSDTSLNALNTAGTAAGFGSGSSDALVAAKTEFTNAYNDIKAEFNTMVSGSLSSGSALLPVFEIGEVKGQLVQADWTKWGGPLINVGNAVVVLASLIAFGIVFSKD